MGVGIRGSAWAGDGAVLNIGGGANVGLTGERGLRTDAGVGADAATNAGAGLTIAGEDCGGCGVDVL